MYALVVTNTIQALATRLPNSARRLDTGAWVMGLATATVALQQATGWYAVVDVAKPADTQTHTHDRTITLVGGIPTETWTQRLWTAEELAARTADTNAATIRSRAETALTANAAFLAIGPAPTNVQVRDHVILMTKECTGLIRLVLDKLDSTEGTA